MKHRNNGGKYENIPFLQALRSIALISLDATHDKHTTLE